MTAVNNAEAEFNGRQEQLVLLDVVLKSAAYGSVDGTLVIKAKVSVFK